MSNVMTTRTETEIIKDRSEVKALLALGFTDKHLPHNACSLDFSFEATEELYEARRAYLLNRSVPCRSFVDASRYVDGLIYNHRQGRLK